MCLAVYCLACCIFCETESKFWKQVKENLPDIHWTRFENWAAQGVPDCYGICDGVSIWVELKVITSNKINLKPIPKIMEF